jgi:hypothetical protein
LDLRPMGGTREKYDYTRGQSLRAKKAGEGVSRISMFDL